MKGYLEKSMNYAEYTALIAKLLKTGKSTGPEQSESRTEFSKLNLHRMRRIEKTFVLDESLREQLRIIAKPMIWLILTEGWCGDAAQSVPAIERIARETELIETRYVLRDENPELMDRFLTNGARSIPKLIALDAEELTILGTWGPRPRAGQAYFEELKRAGLEKSAINEKMQRWYNDDRHRSIQSDLEELLKFRGGNQAVAA